MNPRILLAGAAALLVVLLPSAASAAPAYPAADGRCVDEAEILGADLCTRVTERLRADERKYGDEIAVAVVPTTGDADIKAWSTGLFNRWGVGKAAKNNGVLLVVAVEDHTVRLATGRGMAERLDDASAKEILDGSVVPRFTDDEYAAGILDGLDEVRRTLGHKVTTGNALAPLAADAISQQEPVAEEPAYFGGEPDEGFDYPMSVEEDTVGTPIWPFALLAMGVITVVGLAAARSGSSAPGGGGSGPVARRTGPHSPHHWSHHSHTSSGFYSAGSTFDSSSPSSSSSSSDSSFGGGSSDGGGSSSSW